MTSTPGTEPTEPTVTAPADRYYPTPNPPHARHAATEPGNLVRRYLDQATADQATTTYAVRLLEISRLLRTVAPRVHRIAVFVSDTPRRAHIRLLDSDAAAWHTTAASTPGWLAEWRGEQGETWDDIRTAVEDHLTAALAAVSDPAQLWARAGDNQMRRWGLNPRLSLWSIRPIEDRAIWAYNALDQTARRPAAPLDDIRAIVANSLTKEQADYHEQPEEDRAGHPYLSLLAVNNWLAQVDPHADDDEPDAPAPIDPDTLERVLINNIGRHATETIFAELDAAQAAPPGAINPDLRGCMEHGYDQDDVNNVLGEISDDTEHTLVCLWNTYDSAGPGSGSMFYIERDGHLHELAGDLWRWLNDDPDDPDTPANPGHPDTWLGEPAGITTRDLPWTDRRHNYARHDNS